MALLFSIAVRLRKVADVGPYCTAIPIIDIEQNKREDSRLLQPVPADVVLVMVPCLHFAGFSIQLRTDQIGCRRAPAFTRRAHATALPWYRQQFRSQFDAKSRRTGCVEGVQGLGHSEKLASKAVIYVGPGEAWR
jgi:hypothetical protein